MRIGGIRKELGHEGRCLGLERIGELLVCSYRHTTTGLLGTISGPANRLSSDTEPARPLILDSPTSGTVRSTMLVTSHPVYGVLLEQPELTRPQKLLSQLDRSDPHGSPVAAIHVFSLRVRKSAKPRAVPGTWHNPDLRASFFQPRFCSSTSSLLPVFSTGRNHP